LLLYCWCLFWVFPVSKTLFFYILFKTAHVSQTLSSKFFERTYFFRKNIFDWFWRIHIGVLHFFQSNFWILCKKMLLVVRKNFPRNSEFWVRVFPVKCCRSWFLDNTFLYQIINSLTSTRHCQFLIPHLNPLKWILFFCRSIIWTLHPVNPESLKSQLTMVYMLW